MFSGVVLGKRLESLVKRDFFILLIKHAVLWNVCLFCWPAKRIIPKCLMWDCNLMVVATRCSTQSQVTIWVALYNLMECKFSSTFVKNLIHDCFLNKHHSLHTTNKRLIRDYWCLHTPISMYVMSQCHDITPWRHDNCNSLWFSLRKFWISENMLVDHISVLQTAIILLSTKKKYSDGIKLKSNLHIHSFIGLMQGTITKSALMKPIWALPKLILHTREKIRSWTRHYTGQLKSSLWHYRGWPLVLNLITAIWLLCLYSACNLMDSYSVTMGASVRHDI